MKKCPFCAQDIPEDAKVCKFCSSTVVRKCPFCAEEIAANAKACRFCRSEISDGPGGAAPAKVTSSEPSGPLGEDRGVGMAVVLTFLTCGIYGLVLLYKIGDELNRHQDRNRINPGVDLLLTLCTCGLWSFVIMYKYPAALREIAQAESRPVVDITVPCLLLSLLGGFPGWLAAIAILQSEVNKHWEAHRAQGT